MKRQSTVLLAAGILALGALACFKDPVASLQGSAARVSVSRRILQQNVGDTDVVNVQVLDAQGNPLVLSGVTLASLDPTVADVAPLPDSTRRDFPGNTLTKIIVFAKSAGQTRITIAANGVMDTLTVTSYPTAFTGIVTPASIRVGDTVTVTAPAGITFSGTGAFAYPSGGRGYIRLVSRTATTLKYVVTETAAAPGVNFTVSGGILLGTIPLPTLTSSTKIVVLPDASEPANDASAGAVAMGTLAATNDSLVRYGQMDDVDVTDYWKFTMGVTGTVSVRIDFAGSGSGSAGNPDYDVVVCTTLSAGGSCGYGQDLIPGNAASAANNPEAGTTAPILAGTTVYVRMYAYPASAADRSGYRLRVKTP